MDRICAAPEGKGKRLFSLKLSGFQGDSERVQNRIYFVFFCDLAGADAEPSSSSNILGAIVEKEDLGRAVTQLAQAEFVKCLIGFHVADGKAEDGFSKKVGRGRSTAINLRRCVGSVLLQNTSGTASRCSNGNA